MAAGFAAMKAVRPAPFRLGFLWLGLILTFSPAAFGASLVGLNGRFAAASSGRAWPSSFLDEQANRLSPRKAKNQHAGIEEPEPRRSEEVKEDDAGDDRAVHRGGAMPDAPFTRARGAQFWNVTARCSFNADDAHLLPGGMPCPAQCPFSQPVEGVTCEKVCVRATQCRDFHPVRFFASRRTMRCEPPCGDGDHRVGGCKDCAGPGICKRCSTGLFGITSLELSADGKQCINPAKFWWYTFYAVVFGILCIFSLYLLAVTSREVSNKDVIEKALDRREKARTELMVKADERDLSLIWANMHQEGGAPDFTGGRGVALYFNWLIFAMVVAFVLGLGGFFAFELSDLASHIRNPHRCQAIPVSAALSPRVSGFHFQDGMVHDQHHETEHDAVVAVENTDDEQHDRDRDAGVADKIEQYTIGVVDAVRELSAPLKAPMTKGIEQKYLQYHTRMFKACIAIYAIVTLLCLLMHGWQLRYTSARFDHEPCMRHFAAIVKGLPSECINGLTLTEHIRAAFEAEDKEQLWRLHGGDATGAGAPQGDAEGAVPCTGAAAASIEDRFHVVGSSIAYDFYDFQEEINCEVDGWIQDLEGSWQSFGEVGPSQNLTEYPDLDGEHSTLSTDIRRSIAASTIDIDLDLGPRRQQAFVGRSGPRVPTASRGVQTETRGEIMKALDPQVAEDFAQWKANEHRAAFVDSFLIKILGMREEWQQALYCSGTAFVVFSTQAARDSAIDLSKTGRLRPLAVMNKKTGKEDWHKITLAEAPCEPVSIVWQNFSSWIHFPQKIFLGVLLMLLTIVVWILLYLPYAAFYAELVTIPGMAPDAAQDVMLGLLIAIGNAALALVIDKVTAWAGFLYTDTRDRAVLVLAFLGTLMNTIFDLAMVALVARGAKLDSAFQGTDTGYDTVVANELFRLLVPGYLIVPYIGCPIMQHVVPYYLAKILIRTHVRVKLRHASPALLCPDFDVCWRYADILNTTTVCTCLLFFTSARAWKVMVWLFLSILLMYCIDKFLLLRATSTRIYDTHRLSVAFGRWWCVPTGLLCSLIMYWGHKAHIVTSLVYCVAFPSVHVVVFLMAMLQVQFMCQTRGRTPLLYPEAVQQLRAHGKPWDFFNTNPVFCLRTRCLGPTISAWQEITSFIQRHGGDGVNEKPPEDCVPFARGSVWLLSATDRTPHLRPQDAGEGGSGADKNIDESPTSADAQTSPDAAASPSPVAAAPEKLAALDAGEGGSAASPPPPSTSGQRSRRRYGEAAPAEGV
jgi:hypothetical protein